MDEQNGLHILVRGKVQGVFFRVFTKAVAKELSIAGWVRNLDDGMVEIMAQGKKAPLELFLKQISHGPPAAKVKEVKASPVDYDALLSDFKIL